MEVLDREVMPTLARLMTLRPGNDHHPDILWLYNWLTQPDRNVKEFHYVLGPLHDKVLKLLERYAYRLDDNALKEFHDIVGPQPESERQNMLQFFQFMYDGVAIYIFRTAAEALMTRCPVLEGQWELVAWRIFEKLSECKHVNYGPASNKLSKWIIRVVGAPDLCPNPDLRIHMLNLYRTLVKIDDHNRKQALESVMSVYSFLDTFFDALHEERSFIFNVKTKDIIDWLMLFTDNNYLYEFGLSVAEKLRHHRYKRQEILIHDISHDYSMGLKVIAEPRELLFLIAILKYITDDKRLLFIEYTSGIEEACSGLLFLVKNFKGALQEPELLSLTVESIMYLLVSVVNRYRCQGGNGGNGSDCLYYINTLLGEFCNELDDCTVAETTVGQEIIIRYKGWICNTRSLFNEEFQPIIPMIWDILYNDEY